MTGLETSRQASSATGSTARARRGPLRVSYRAAPGEPRVLYAVPKSVGTAVVRNRARRRVRETLRELSRDGSVVLEGGEYRFGVSSSLGRLSSAELRSVMGELLREVRS